MEDKENRNIFKAPTKKHNNTGIGKIIVRTISGIIFSLIALGGATWIIALFKPENLQKAIEIVKNIF